jgi:hypothetical protein
VPKLAAEAVNQQQRWTLSALNHVQPRTGHVDVTAKR